MENNTAGRTDTGSLNDMQSATPNQDTGGSRNLIDRAEQQAREKINAAKKDAGLTLSSVASTLLNSSSQLKDEQQNLAGEYVGKAAEQIDRLANYIQNADPVEVVDNVEDFARRRPALFIGAAFALGVIGARFLKSSRRRVDREQRLSSPGITDREVPTLRSVEANGYAGSAGVGGTSADLRTTADGIGTRGLGMSGSAGTSGTSAGLSGTTGTGNTHIGGTSNVGRNPNVSGSGDISGSGNPGDLP